MSYEVRINGQTVAHCTTTDEALARVREELQFRPDHESEILDNSTGKPFAPASSRGWRDQLANEMGY